VVRELSLKILFNCASFTAGRLTAETRWAQRGKVATNGARHSGPQQLPFSSTRWNNPGMVRLPHPLRPGVPRAGQTTRPGKILKLGRYQDRSAAKPKP
jgi:hypothetical protein